MASTFSDLKIELMATGENSGTWGDITNVNLGTAIEEAITGSADVTFSSADITLTLTDSNASQTARNLRLNLTGTTGAARNLVVPAIEKMYLVNNGCAHTVTVKTSAGTGVAVPAGKSMLVFTDGTNVTDALTSFVSKITSVDNAIVRFTGTDGDVQTSSATIDDSGNITATAFVGSGTSLTGVVLDTDIGVTVQGYDADTAKYDDATANFTGTLQNGGSNVVVDSDIGITIQGYDADTAKYDDATANFTGTLQNGGSNVVVDSDIGITIQGYDANLTPLATNGAGAGNNQFVQRDASAKIPVGTTWSVYESAGVLYFEVSGVAKAKLDTSGNLTCVGDITAYGTI